MRPMTGRRPSEEVGESGAGVSAAALWLGELIREGTDATA
jgi:hypothetical protein